MAFGGLGCGTLSLCHNPQVLGLLLIPEGGATNHSAFHSLSSVLLKLFSVSESDPPPLNNCLCGHLPPRLCGMVPQAP
jgi:hypothetical protein